VKVIESVVLENFINEMKQVIGKNQHRFTKRKSCQANLITLYSEIRSVDMGRAVHVGYLDITKAFDTVSHSLLDKVARCRFDVWSVTWAGNWLTGHTQMVVINVFY